MSANNWRDCPRCLRESRIRAALRLKDAHALYGTVSRADYEAALAEVSEQDELDFESVDGGSFRENFRILTRDDGVFTVSYSGSCGICGFEHKFRCEQQTLSDDSGSVRGPEG